MTNSINNKKITKMFMLFNSLSFIKLIKGWCSNGIDIDHENIAQIFFIFCKLIKQSWTNI